MGKMKVQAARLVWLATTGAHCDLHDRMWQTMILLWLEPLGGAFLALSARHSGPIPSWGPPTHSPAGSCPCPGENESAHTNKLVPAFC